MINYCDCDVLMAFNYNTREDQPSDPGTNFVSSTDNEVGIVLFKYNVTIGKHDELIQ